LGSEDCRARALCGHEGRIVELGEAELLNLVKSGSARGRGHVEALAGLILSAWSLTDKETNTRWVTDEELRDALLKSNDDFRSNVLWHMERWVKENRERWRPLLLNLVTKVWPRQLAVKSGLVSALLCDIALADEESVPELAAAVMPLLTKTDCTHLRLPSLRRSRGNVVDSHPREVLGLLHLVLPDNVAAWPFGIADTIDRIGRSEMNLLKDERFVELKRKWDAR